MQKLFKEVIQRSNRRWAIGFSVAALLVCAAFGQVSTGKGENKSQIAKDQEKLANIKAGYLSGPLTFEVNRGQTDAKVKFLTRAQGFTVFMMPGETLLRGRNADVLRMKLQNGNPSPKIEGEDRQAKISNYYIGKDRSKWLEGVPNYGQVRYHNVYSGIDMVYHSDQHQIEYDFVVQPGADPNQIQVAFEGAEKIRINELGELELTAGTGTSVNHKPVVYQTIAGHRKVVQGEYALANNTVGFKLGAYDHTQPLVIDPTLQVISFFGGTLNDETAGIATNALQAGTGIVIVGRTESVSLGGASGKSNGINWDGFATGLNAGTPGFSAAGGTTAQWTTYIGGSGDDAARGVAMDNQGNVYVGGYTNSADFPSTAPPVNYDGFLVKLGNGGSRSSVQLYGGPGVDQITSVALDYSTFASLANATSILSPSTDNRVIPNVVVGGFTTGNIGGPGSTTIKLAGGTGNTATTTPDGNQRVFNQCDGGVNCTALNTTDGFVAIFDSVSMGVRHATYLGGGGNDQVNAVAVDIWGNIYATGYATPAVSPVFPTVNGIGQGTSGGPGAIAQDAALNTATINNQRTAVAFVAKYACAVTDGSLAVPAQTSGVYPIGVPSPAPRIEACAGRNNLAILSNSALFGGSGSFINPQQIAQNQQAISEAGLGIAVDVNGWGSQQVTNNPDGTLEVIPFPTVWGAASTDTIGSTVIVGPQAPLVEPCVPPGRNPATPQANSTFCVPTPIAGVNNEGGFQPGIAGPRVYVVGSTANANFSNSLTNPSCATGVNTGAGSAPNPAPVPLCAVPGVFGGAVVAPGSLPVPGNGPARITAIAGTPSGQTQGWLVAFQFPAVTQEVITPALTTTPLLATSLAPPTIPLWVTLQPPSCPGLLNGTADNGACVQGAPPGLANVGTSASPLANTCTLGGGGVTCPTAFIGSWNGVAVDSDQQVYVVGQMGMSGARAPIFGAGLSTRLALEIERISPLGIPEVIFPNAAAALTSSFLIDTAVGGNNYCQILPTAPPSPDPNQPGGLNCGIALNQFREAFLAGTTTAATPAAPPAPAQASATANITNVAGSVTIGVCPTPNPAPGGGGAAGGPICPAGQTGGAGYAAGALAIVVNNVTCSTAPGPFTVTVDGNGAITAINPAISGAGCVAAGGSPTVTIPAPPAAPATPFSLLFSPINAALNVPTGTSAFNISGSGNSKNASTGGATEDVIYSAIQFYDAIASPSTIDFTATVNSVPSITGPDGTTGAVGNPAVPNAKAFINFVNWQGQPLNIPPGCVITPNVATVTNPAAFGGAATYTPFTVTPVQGTSQFIVTINNPATVVGFPGVISSLVTFNKTGPCSGNGPAIEGFDPVRITMAVSAPVNVVPENTLQVTSALASGILQPYFNNGVQLVANNGFSVNVDVTTANASAPINVTAEIVPGQNWSGGVINAFTVGNPNGRNNTLWSVGGPNNGLRAIPINVNPAVIANLPVGTYTATLVIAASPETPALPTSGSTACNSPATPLGSGTTSAVCLPISVTVTPQAITNIPAAIVFQNSNTPQQTGLNIANPLGTAGPFNFTALYQPTPIYGTALPAANVFYVGTGSTLTSAIGNTVSGSIASGGTFTVPIQVNPAGLPTGVYSGQLLVSNNGLASGATPQTTVPLIVYVGPHTGEDTPSGNGLGLMLPVNTPPTGTGVLPGTAQASVNPTASSPGAYPLILSVPSGYGVTGGNQALNPTIVQVTGLNNTATTPFNVNPPIVQGFPVGTVTVTNPTAGFGGTPTVCSSTYSQLTSLPGTPLGPSCAYALWVDATTLNSSNTQQLAVCGTPGNNFGLTGSLLFTPAPNSFPFASFTVPVTVCVTDFPALIVAMPTTFPNPTFGPFFTGGNAQQIAQPANVTPGFQQVLVDMQIAAGAGCSGTACVAGPISLFAQAGNSSQVCKVLDIHTNGGLVPGVTIAPIGNQWLTIQPAPALFRGVGGIGTLNGFGVAGIGGLPVALGSQFSAGPITVGPGMNTFQVCANTDPLGNVAGTFSSAIVINGAGVGAVTIPVNFIVGNATGTTPPTGGANFSQLAVFRPTNQPPAMAFFLDSNGNNTWDACVPGTERTTCANDKIRFFGNDAIAAAGTARDIAVAGDWDGTGVVRFGVFHCAASGTTQCAWYIDLNNNGVWDGTAGGDAIWIFGIPGDTPVVGDWTGDGKSKIGVFRCTAGLPECQWFLDLGNKHTWDPATAGVYRFGLPGDKPAVGTWTPGSSADQVGVMHCTTAGAACTWIVDSLGKTGTAGFNAELFDPGDRMFSFTGPGGFVVGDVPVVGNWNGNGTKRAGVFRTSTGVWYVDTNGNGSLDPADQVFTNFGLPGDQPLVGFWTLPGAQLVQ